MWKIYNVCKGLLTELRNSVMKDDGKTRICGCGNG